MKIKILAILLFYYGIISLLFLMSGDLLTDNNYTNTISLNDSDITADEIDAGGLFTTGVSVLRFVGFVGFGVGLPDDTPNWFSIPFAVWSTLVTIITIAFIISSIWDG